MGLAARPTFSGPLCVISSAIKWWIRCPSAQPSAGRAVAAGAPQCRDWLPQSQWSVCRGDSSGSAAGHPGCRSVPPGAESARCLGAALSPLLAGPQHPDKFQGMDPLSVLRIARVSIPSREFALLRPQVHAQRCESMRFQSLPGNLPFCGRWNHGPSLVWDQSFNPLQGICPSAAKPCLSRCRARPSVSIPYREFALLRH